MTGSSWSTGAEVSGNRRRRRNLLEGKIIGEGAGGMFSGGGGNREAGAGENLPAVATTAAKTPLIQSVTSEETARSSRRDTNWFLRSEGK